MKLQNEFLNRTYELSSKQQVCINFVKELATLSKCKHGKVAAILVNHSFTQIYSMGINGGPSGQVDCCCKPKNAKYGCAHAEQNCLVKNTDKSDTKIMICTTECCPTCATLIVNSNADISEFWYINEYKDHTGLQILNSAGILSFKIID